MQPRTGVRYGSLWLAFENGIGVSRADKETGRPCPITCIGCPDMVEAVTRRYPSRHRHRVVKRLRTQTISCAAGLLKKFLDRVVYSSILK